MSEIPQWADGRAFDLFNAELDLSGSEGSSQDIYKRAFARYISEHEEPPVDPVLVKTAAAFEALWNEDEYGTVERWAGRLQMLLSAQGLKIVEASDV